MSRIRKYAQGLNEGSAQRRGGGVVTQWHLKCFVILLFISVIKIFLLAWTANQNIIRNIGRNYCECKSYLKLINYDKLPK